MRKFAILGLLAVAAASQAGTWDSGTGLNWAIADVATTTFNFTPTPGAGAVTGFDMFLSPAHTWRGDLIVTLTSANASSTTLMSNVGGSGDLISVFFSDTGIAIPTSGNLDSATTGISYMSGGNTLASLGAFQAGTWTLTVQDTAGGDTGTIDRIRLTTTAVPEPASMAALGLGALALIRKRRAKK